MQLSVVPCVLRDCIPKLHAISLAGFSKHPTSVLTEVNCLTLAAAESDSFGHELQICIVGHASMGEVQQSLHPAHHSG